jgi:protein ImuB
VIDRETILVTSNAAAQSGVRIGMRRASVAAIAPELQLLDREKLKEQMALNSVGLTLLQYTPEVVFAEDDSILLDVTASISAFDGRLVLCRRVKKSISVLGFTAQISCAPTARGAWLLARYAVTKTMRSFPSRIRRTLKMTSMIKRLDALPCTLLSSARPHQEWLHGIGCRVIGDLRKLPRAGLQRRTNTQMLLELDQAYGTALEVFEWIKAPTTFSAKLDMPDRTDLVHVLLISAKRLIAQLIGWLVSLQKAVTQLVLWLEHERGRYAIPATPINIWLAEPTWQETHIVSLLKERLDRTELITPVIAMRLETIDLTPMLPPTESLFPEPGGTPADFNRLLELLKARLGDDGVLCPTPLADHRPEISNHWTPATLNLSQIRSGELPLVTQEENIYRPCFLLAQPIVLLIRDHRPFYGSPLRLIQGPERIEAGWWDGQVVVRDYFVAQSTEGACYWIYQERAQSEARWFLHGLFA